MKQSDIPNIVIEQYVLGELSAERVLQLEKRPGVAERVAEMRRSNEEILAQYPPEQFAVRIRNQIERETETASSRKARPAKDKVPRRPLWWVAWALPGAAVAAAVLIIGIQLLTGTAVPDPGNLEEIVRLKGSDPALLVYRSVDGAGTQDDNAESLEHGSSAQAGDMLQLAYNAGTQPYGVIVSIDGRGMVTLQFPREISAEPVLVVGRREKLPYGYILDDAPDFERFFFITSDHTFSVQTLMQTIRAQADAIVSHPDRELQLDSNFTVISMTLIKGE